MIESIVPGVVATAWRHDDTEAVSLFPEETAAVARAVATRQREFATVRLCARLALRDLGLPPAPLTPGPRGAPRWPRGVAGSMTHCAGYRAAALARTADVVSIGIDAEPAGPLPEEVFDAVTLPEERRRLTKLAAQAPELPWDRLLFSAKESVFKTWYPLTGRGLEFEEAALEFTRDGGADPRTGTFRAELAVPGPVADGTRRDHFTGRWLVSGGLVLTAIVLAR
ncbi:MULTISPECIES: 4'-phosphopantetheinyl transferase superfamily protein [unclassified Streptomyces]|uniref:4'-phosphopantetheinyl transferase family protein n=1 Tax=unclassified Streptomyces TaxID=2593676 RepID=UPI0006F87167|nr:MULTISPECIES: 4'-phosphopantetheinyl transferase superfamily protein [unclassified Streptomyces]KQX56278.1 4'-phosphopantetheinyl transferase [Streptomyces sp. Root1304]KRA97093.1 4'-phosphopantetheinyl transferase [Streptomyces sp. Root66D1]